MEIILNNKIGLMDWTVEPRGKTTSLNKDFDFPWVQPYNPWDEERSLTLMA